MKDATILSITGIIALVIIEVTCIFNGIDHFVTATTVAAIAGLAGYELKARRGSSDEW